jgi:hypothetical protein
MDLERATETDVLFSPTSRLRGVSEEVEEEQVEEEE